MAQPYSETPRAYRGYILTWYQIWWRAISQPSLETYEAIVYDPNARIIRPFRWLLSSAWISFMMMFAIQLAKGTPLAGQTGQPLGVVILIGLCAAPFVALFAALVVVILAGTSHWIATRLDAEGPFIMLVYAMAAFFSPLLLLAVLLGSVPAAGPLLVALLAAYGVFLNIQAVRAVHALPTWQAAIASLPVILLAGLVFAGAGDALLGSIIR